MTSPERVPMDGVCACGHAGIDHRMAAPHLCKVIEGMASSLCRCAGYAQKTAPVRPEVPAQRNPGDAETWAGRDTAVDPSMHARQMTGRTQPDYEPPVVPMREVKPVGPDEGAPGLKFEEIGIGFQPAPLSFLTAEERATLSTALDAHWAQLEAFSRLRPESGIAGQYRIRADALKAARAKAGL